MVDITNRGATACAACAKAKVRCVRSALSQQAAVDSPTGEGICDRCRRLKKVCIPQHTDGRAAPLPRTRFGQLEKKVEALIETLSHQTQTPASTLDTGFGNILKPRPTIQHQSPQHHNPPPRQTWNEKEAARGTTQVLSPDEYATPGRHDPLWPSDEEGDCLLSMYNEILGCVFPFVVTPHLPASQFRRTRPYLFKAMVMAATYRDRELQKRRASDFISSLSADIILRGEKSLDMLQSLLVHIAWYQCHLQRNTQMTNLTQMAIAVLADLELNKPYHANDRRKMIFDPTRSSFGFTTETMRMNNEERRALLACFYFSSTGSTVYRKVDALTFTPHMEDALADLVASNEYPTDILLESLVRSQQIVYDISQVVPYDDPSRPRCTGPAFLMHLKTLDRMLNDFQASLPPALSKHDFLLMHLHTARIFLYEVSLYDTPWQGTTTRDRLDALFTCSKHLSSFFETFFLFPDEAFFVLPYSLWGQLSHALLTSSRLCLLVYQGWSIEFVDESVRLLPVLQQVLDKLERATATGQKAWLGDKSDLILEKVHAKLKWVVEWWQDSTNTTAMTTPARDDLAFVNSKEANIFTDGRFWEEMMADMQGVAYPAI